MFIPSPLRSNSRPPRKKVHDKIPRTSFCVTSLKSKRMLHEPRSTFSPIPQSLSLKEPAPRPSPPAHPFLASPQFQTTNRRPQGDAPQKERPLHRALPQANSAPIRRDPAYTPRPYVPSTILAKVAENRGNLIERTNNMGGPRRLFQSQLRNSSPDHLTLLQTKIASRKRLCDRLWLTARNSLTDPSGGCVGTDLWTNPFLSVAL
jgi:hypothetical protein